MLEIIIMLQTSIYLVSLLLSWLVLFKGISALDAWSQGEMSNRCRMGIDPQTLRT